jgi:hypothetical protein
MAKIKAIPYDHIEQKNELERKLFSKLSPSERFVAKKSWFRLLEMVSKSGGWLSKK